MPNIALFGPPGAGKGTQSQKLIQTYQYTAIALGDLLREQVSQQTALGQQINSYISMGKLVPDTLAISIVEAQVIAKKHSNRLLFDGFPRTVRQATALETMLASHQMTIDGVLFLDVPEAELVQRIQGRAKMGGRTDDQDTAKVATRMRIYADETLPVAQYYAQQGKLLKIDGTGLVEQVTKRIFAAVDKLSCADL